MFLDINECVEKQIACEQDCRNTPGSYVCSCRKGYQTVSTGRCIGNYL